jgi:hypothetical protein
MAMARKTRPAGEAFDDGVEVVRIKVGPTGRVDPPNAARFLNRTEKTLSQWRWLGVGPEWEKVHGRVFYNFPNLKTYR